MQEMQKSCTCTHTHTHTRLSPWTLSSGGKRIQQEKKILHKRERRRVKSKSSPNQAVHAPRCLRGGKTEMQLCVSTFKKKVSESLRGCQRSWRGKRMTCFCKRTESKQRFNRRQIQLIGRCVASASPSFFGREVTGLSALSVCLGSGSGRCQSQ